MNAPFAVRPLAGIDTAADELVVAPSLERRRLQCYLALMVGDIVSIFAGFGLAGYLFSGMVGLSDALGQSELLLPVFLTIALYNGSYSVAALRDSWVGIFRSQAALLLSVAAVVFIAFFAKASSDFSRLGFSSGTICTILLLLWMRLQMRSFTQFRCGSNPYNELVIDDGGPRVDIPGAIRVSANAMGLKPNLNDPHMLDRIGLALRNIDRVIVSCPAARRADWAMMLKGANVDGEVLDDEVARLGAQGARVHSGHGLLLVSAGPLGLRDRIIKRLLDVSFAGTAILMLSPLLLAVAAAIKLQDRGPVFFVQRRMGRGNRFFNMYKFRSMTVALCDSEGNVSASKGDQRITRVGRFIRSTSIDELPQLFNVLLGDMSLVGPRPHAIGSQAGSKLFWEVDLRYWQRHSLKPGLSGLAQVRGFRGATEKESDLVSRLQSDLEYLEGWTILRDIKIIFLTLRVLVHDRAF
ncbi:lipopolysaccharide/colanic/teichoic acid biosynthesis glycosyltransferase [Novosphingobium chloroacetimidivorans]|uniref:Lipopolysaccharide/colanic/teichoic acid biosynthesis glycosyltransferase n=1 Tax=Novosphingobium chloroacetimidivorans TaxID=1428314 RepID=A0A7W7KD31_9SPHN|nr:sugar transferase [Novosphingobium chloroacetimidivorans]MBB4860008.1 lipopolysaccharide/colanic/teichoic acid biosynthesis glycosyltransferase [Novosphingobium chloroacetimidivorans]